MDKYCSTCRHWNIPTSLRQYRDWADCYCVVAALKEELLNSLNVDGVKFSIPFDPAYEKLFKVNPIYRKAMKEIHGTNYPGIRQERSKGKIYFKTNYKTTCKYYYPNIEG